LSLSAESWFSTFELPEKTAFLVRDDKEKKHVVRMEKQANGNYIIFYRGLTDEEKLQRKEQAKVAKNTIVLP